MCPLMAREPGTQPLSRNAIMKEGQLQRIDGHVGVNRDDIGAPRQPIPRRSAAPLPEVGGLLDVARVLQVSVDFVRAVHRVVVEPSSTTMTSRRLTVSSVSR